MAQTKHEIQAILESAASEPRKRFGQNFMIDGNLVRLIAEAGGISPGDLVIEVGPGTGTLTEELLSRGARVTAVEIDRTLAALLRHRFTNCDQFQLIEGDALAGKHAIHPQLAEIIQKTKSQQQTVRLVANLPYNIASPLIIELLIAGVDELAFTVQKEVADRLRAVPGSKDYGPLSIMAQLLSQVEMLRTISRQAFWPMPGVESALVRLVRQESLGDRASTFSGFVHQLFSARRKTLKNALAQAGYAPEESLAKSGMPANARAEQFPPQEILRLFEAAGRAVNSTKPAGP